jgi:hypothetical protein
LAPFTGLWLLDLHNHLGTRKYIGCTAGDLSASGQIGIITGTNTGTCPCLNQHPMPTASQFSHRIRYQTNT